VGPIITSQEVKAWKELENNAERERFIEDFWDRRKPDRDSTRTSIAKLITNGLLM